MRVRADDDDWRRELDRLGIAAEGSGPAAPELAVGDARAVERLVEQRPRVMVVEGDGRGILRRAGYDVSVYVVLPDPHRPRLIVAPAHREAAGYAVRTRVAPVTRAKRLRRTAAATLLRHGVRPPFLPLVSVAGAGPAPPFLVAAAEAAVGRTDLGWFMVPGSGDVLSRGVFFLFLPGSPRPEWVLKFARVCDYDEPFVREENALRTARSVGAVVARHSPAPLGRLDVGARAASLETAALGRRLDAILDGLGPRSEKLTAVERVLDWLLDVALASRGSVDALKPEWERLRALAGGAAAEGAPVRLPEAPFCPAVLQHNDLGGWNVLVDDDEFVAVDWESANRFGVPLWDGWYFLAHVLPLVAEIAPEHLDLYLRRLFRGEDRWSPLVFEWTRRAAAQLGIPRSRIGTLAALCWLHHAQSHGTRAVALSRHRGGEPLQLVTQRLPRLWLGDEGLGTEWRSLPE